MRIGEERQYTITESENRCRGLLVPSLLEMLMGIKVVEQADDVIPLPVHDAVCDEMQKLTRKHPDDVTSPFRLTAASSSSHCADFNENTHFPLCMYFVFPTPFTHEPPDRDSELGFPFVAGTDGVSVGLCCSDPKIEKKDLLQAAKPHPAPASSFPWSCRSLQPCPMSTQVAAEPTVSRSG